MLFTGISFLVFLPLAFILYHACFFSRKLRNIVLLVISLLFNAFGQTIFVCVLGFSILWNWAAALLIEKNRETRRRRKIITALAITVNLAVLVFFKQLNPVLLTYFGNIDLAPLLRLGLPLGLSYFTLEAIGYIVDVYWGECEAERNPLYVALYLSFFPKMAAGPLSSFDSLKKQMLQRDSSLDRISAGFCRFTGGLAKVVLLGNIMARISGYVFTWSAMGRDFFFVPVTLAWLGLLAFILRMYHQLSGFCDMAIGLAMMFEFRLPEDFSRPFNAASLKEFWQRWNITVLGWFNKYAFTFFRSFSPRLANMDMVLLHLFLTWFFYAFWHSANWSVIFWGVLQFLFLLAEHFFVFLGGKRGSWYMRLYFTTVLVLSFVFLRTESLYAAGLYFKNLFALNKNGFFSDIALVFIREYWLWLLTGIAACFPVISILRKLLFRLGRKYFIAASVSYPVIMAGLLVVVLIYLFIEPQIPFRYF